MITNKDIRVENGNLVLNGDKFPLDGQSPEAIMEIVKDNSDTTPTENSTAPVTSGGIYTAVGSKRSLSVSSTVIGDGVNVASATSTNPYTTPHEGFVRFSAAADSSVSLAINDYRTMRSTGANDYKGMWLPKGVKIYFADGTPTLAQWFDCSEA